MFSSMLVLEAPWNDQTVSSPSVWPFVSEFARARGISAFRQSFSDKDSFNHWIRCYNAEKIPGSKLLYVAAHGENGRIQSLARKINRDTVISTLKAAKKIEYVHFGTCFFGSEANLSRLLDAAKHIKWAAGYDQTVDWVDSTLFDIMLWGRIESRDEDTKGKKSHILTAKLLSEAPGLAAALGFCFQHRYGKKVKSVVAPIAKA